MPPPLITPYSVTTPFARETPNHSRGSSITLGQLGTGSFLSRPWLRRPQNPQPSEEGVGGCGPAPQSPTCQACRSSSRSCTRRLHMSVSFNSRGSEAAPLKLPLAPPLPCKSRGAFLLASLPGPSGGPQLRAPHPVLAPRFRSLRPAPCSLHPLQHPGCLLRDVRKPALRSLRNR